MQRILSIGLFTLVLFAAPDVSAQKKTSNKPAKTTTVAEAAAQTSSPSVAESSDAMLLNALAFDSSLAPADALTTEIRQLLTSTRVVATAVETIRNLIEIQKNVNNSSEAIVYFNRFMAEVNSPRVRALFENMYIKIYRNQFTLDEVRQLNAFYKTPIGIKTLTTLPQIMRDSQLEGEKLGTLISHQILTQLTNEK